MPGVPQAQAESRMLSISRAARCRAPPAPAPCRRRVAETADASACSAIGAPSRSHGAASASTAAPTCTRSFYVVSAWRAAPACALQCCPGLTRPLVGHHPRLIFDTVRATALPNLTLHEGRRAPRPSAQVRMLPAPRHTRSATSLASATARAAGAPLALHEAGSQPSPLSSAAAGAAGSSVACKRRSTARTRGAALPRGRGAAGGRGPAAGRALSCRLRQSAVPARLACRAGKDKLARCQHEHRCPRVAAHAGCVQNPDSCDGTIGQSSTPRTPRTKTRHAARQSWRAPRPCSERA